MNSNLMDVFYGTAIVPVIVLDDTSKAVSLAKALCAGGIPVAEVTLRTDSALEVIKEMCGNVPEIIVGAGTVHTVEQAKSAIEAGAKFIVTPGFVPTVVKWCIENNIIVFPGCSTASDLEKALEFGLKTVKFFPAESSGGIKAIKALSGPYNQIKFMPTGGINENNISDYLSLDNVFACGGSWMVPQELIEKSDFSQITNLCKAAIHKAFGFELMQIGINACDKSDTSNIANKLADLFSLTVVEQKESILAGTLFEILKQPSDNNSYIAIRTNNIERAVKHFQLKGADFDFSTAKRDENGKLIDIYFKEQIGGFAFCLRR